MPGFVDVKAKRCSFAHHALKEPIFDIARRVEPFIQKRVPRPRLQPGGLRQGPPGLGSGSPAGT